MNILHLVPRETYVHKMSRVRFEAVDALVATGQHTVDIWGPGWEGWNEAISATDNVLWKLAANRALTRGYHYHLALCYDMPALRAAASEMGLSLPTVVIFHETYNHVQVLNTIHSVDARLVVFTYANDLERYRPQLEAEGRVLVHIPHGASSSIYKDYEQPSLRQGWDRKDIDILIIGNLAQEFYPFRHRIARLARRELSKRGYRVCWVAHPGFTLPTKGPVGAEYAKLLNRAKLVITCTGKHRYAFNKLVEIPLCRALPVSDLPAERQAFFAKTMLHVESWMMDREICAKIEDVLDDPGELKRLTTQAHDKVARRLTLAHWAERFGYAVQRFLWHDNPPLPTPEMDPEDLPA